jgi:hypothetical protein
MQKEAFAKLDKTTNFHGSEKVGKKERKVITQKPFSGILRR